MTTGTQTDGTPPAYDVAIGDADFHFTNHPISDRQVTGAQLATLAGKHPVEEFVVLAVLTSREMQLVGPAELVDVTGVAKFFVIRGADLHRFFVDGLAMLWPLETLTGAHIRYLANVPGDDQLLLERTDSPDQEIGDDEVVRIADAGVERFKTRPAKGHITIFVDAEPYVAPRRVMTPDEIIRKAGEKDPAKNYLTRIVPPISYRDKGEIPIRLRNGERFQIVSLGPTPVSDGMSKTGIAAFTAGLHELGYTPSDVPDNTGSLYFDYRVETGVFAGKDVRIGLVIPADFPMNPPTGPHVSPDIHPIKADGDHPTGHVHRDHSAHFQKALGGSWQYWSRPFREWAQSKRNVAAYMNHIWQLWDSQ
jgi:hypothetical protein